MNKFMLAAAASVLLAGSASAADLPSKKMAPVMTPVAPVFTWTGAYVGVTAGGAWFNGKGSDAGFMGGGTLGYNYQLANNIVIGVEGDLSWMPLQRGASSSFTYKGVTANYRKVDATWLGTARGRVGYAFNNVLVYATGGIAGSDVTGSSRAAWTVGGGLEYAFNRSWSVKAEYLYVGMEKQNATVVNAAGAVIGTQKRAADFSVARLGVNYRF